MAISINSDVLVTLSSLRDTITASYLNSATVTGELFTASGTSVTTFSLSYVSASNGNYRGTITQAVTTTLTEGAEYKIKIIATQSGSYLTLWETHLAENTVG